MTTADWALIISLGSFVLALASFVWNVWSKFIYPKPKIRVYLSIMRQVSATGRLVGESALSLQATNFGPSEVTLYAACARAKKKYPWSKRTPIAILNPYRDYPNDLSGAGPFGGGLPKKMEVGEQFSVYFPVERSWFIEEKLAKFGFNDTFGRLHWCSQKDVKRIIERIDRPYQE